VFAVAQSEDISSRIVVARLSNMEQTSSLPVTRQRRVTTWLLPPESVKRS